MKSGPIYMKYLGGIEGGTMTHLIITYPIYRQMITPILCQIKNLYGGKYK